MAGRLFSYQLADLSRAIRQLEAGEASTVLLDLNGHSGSTEVLSLIDTRTMRAVEVQGRLSQFRERDLPPLRYGALPEGQEHSCHPAAMLPRVKGDSWQPPHPWPGEEPDPINAHLGIDAVRPEPGAIRPGAIVAGFIPGCEQNAACPAALHHRNCPHWKSGE